MDRDLDALERAPEFTYRRMWVTLLVSAAVIAAGSLIVRTFPNTGQQAGYDAVITKGADWARAEVTEAKGTALPACDELHEESEASPSSPRYEYESFIEGCTEAVDRVLGGHVPLLSESGG